MYGHVKGETIDSSRQKKMSKVANRREALIKEYLSNCGFFLSFEFNRCVKIVNENPSLQDSSPEDKQ